MPRTAKDKEAIEVIEGVGATEGAEVFDAEERLKERVPFFAMKDSDRYSQDVVAIINGKATVIQRGVETEIPRGVKLVLAHAERQAVKAAELQEELELKTNR